MEYASPISPRVEAVHVELIPEATQRLKQCWQVELFFKWIKQNLHVETFFGQSENAVKTQIWIAICAYLLMAILKGAL